MVRLAVRGFIESEMKFEDFLDGETADIGALAEKHALALMGMPGGEKHMIEFEFLDEPNPLERFFRIGTDTARMVWPIAVNLERLA